MAAISLDLTGVGTLLVAAFTAGLWVTTCLLWTEAKKASQLAASNTQALMNAERPHISLVFVGTEEIARSAAEILYPDLQSDTVRGFRNGARNVRYRITNHGRTPAWLTFVVVRPIAAPALPETPAEDALDFVGGYSLTQLIAPNDSYETHLGLDKTLWDNLWEKGNQLFVWGYIEYQDTFERPHKTGFAFRYVPQGRSGYFEVSGPRNYWYYS